MRLKIQSKLTAVLLGLTLPMVVAISLVAWFNSRSILEGIVRDQIISLNASKEAHLRQSMNLLSENVEALGKDPSVAEALQKFAAASAGSADAEDSAALWEYFRTTYPAEENAPVPEPADSPAARRLQELYVVRNSEPIHENDRLLAAKGDATDYTKVHARYHPVMRRFRDANRIHNLMLVDGSSRRIVYAVLKHADFQTSIDGPTLAGTTLKIAIDRALGGDVAFADYQRFAPAFNVPVAYFVAPVRGENEQVTGAIVAQIEDKFLTRVLAESTPSEIRARGNSDTFLIGADGYFRSEPRALRENFEGLVSELRAQGKAEPVLRRMREEHSAVLSLTISEQGKEKMNRERRGFSNTKGYEGRPVFSTYEPVLVTGVHWFIVTRREESEALAPLTGLRRTLALAVLAVLLIATGAAILLSKALVKPLEGLSEAARRFGKGEREITIAEKSRDDEFGELARQFDAMIVARANADNIQGQIRRNIVHDLKTPVTVIKGMGETLMIPEMAEDATWRDEMVRAIIEQSDRLLDDLRDILLPIDSAYTPDYEDFDLSQVVYRAIQGEKQTARARDHLLNLSGVDAPVPVRADRRKIRRVIENLLSNAIKYSPGNGKHVWIEVHRNGAEIEISVRDEGLGMSGDQLAAVLEGGGRVSDHADLGIEGSGFGLDSVQKVLRAHGGELRVASSPNKGSTFTAIIPAGEDAKLTTRFRADSLY